MLRSSSLRMSSKTNISARMSLASSAFVCSSVSSTLRSTPRSAALRIATSGGVNSLAAILNAADRGVERNVLETLETTNPELANQIRALMFVFEDILKLDDRSIQLILKDVDTKDLALALRGAKEDVSERIMANMSSRGAEMLREEMEFMQPQRRRVIEEAQTKIVAAVRRLEEAGEIVISRGGDDEIVV